MGQPRNGAEGDAIAYHFHDATAFAPPERATAAVVYPHLDDLHGAPRLVVPAAKPDGGARAGSGGIAYAGSYASLEIDAATFARLHTERATAALPPYARARTAQPQPQPPQPKRADPPQQAHAEEPPTLTAPPPRAEPAVEYMSAIAAASSDGRGAFRVRDQLFLLCLVIALSYMAYLTHVGMRNGHADYVFALARTLAGEHARAVVFEFPLVRLLLARLGGSLALLAAGVAAPLSLCCLVLIRVAGRFVVALSCAGALCALLAVAARAAAFFFSTDRIVLAFLCVSAAFTALILLYMLYGWRQALFAFGRLFEDSAAIVLCALPGLCAATFVLGLLYAAFVAWWALTLASLVTTDVSVIVAEASSAVGAYVGMHLAGGGASVRDVAGRVAVADVVVDALRPQDAAPAVVFVGGAALPVYFCLFLFLWMSNIFNGVLRVAVAGGARAWQRGESASLGVVTTLGRALTFSLGSIALASLIVSMVEFVYMVVDRTRATVKRVGVRAAASLIKIVVVVFAAVLRYINSYVYVEIAASGSSFFDANARVFALFRKVPSKALLGYASASYVLVALRYAIAFLSVLVAALLRPQISDDGRALPLAAVLWSRSALVAYVAAYLVSALPTAWLETSAHARLVLEMEGAAADERADAPSINT